MLRTCYVWSGDISTAEVAAPPPGYMEPSAAETTHPHSPPNFQQEPNSSNDFSYKIGIV